MRLILYVVSAICGSLLGCNFITPFNDEDQEVRPGAIDGFDLDVDGSPGDSDMESESPCVAECGGRDCGPDGCGETCGSCDVGEACVACPPWVRCEVEYSCQPFAVETWVYLHTNTLYPMGSPPTEVERGENEPLRDVTLTHDFVIESSEVSQNFYSQLENGRNPSYFSSMGRGEPCGGGCPVERVTWHDAARATNYMSRETGLEECYVCDEEGCDLGESFPSPYDCQGYRLPTEAEWEFAARAGSRTATYAGELAADDVGCSTDYAFLDEYAWFCGNSDGSTHPSGLVAPNEWGLFDMLGNVAEWCHDYYDDDLNTEFSTDPWGAEEGSHRIFRGGAWSDRAEVLRAANRQSVSPDSRADIGFRPVRTVR